MRLATELRKLEHQREHELGDLRARFNKVADIISHDVSPAEWVRKHPYLTTAGAALAGFAVAQLAGRSRAAAPAAPAPEAPASPAAAVVQGSLLAGLLPTLMSLAQHVFQQPPAEESAPAEVTVANAGSVAGLSFSQATSWGSAGTAGMEADGSAI